MARYLIVQTGVERFDLYEDGAFLCSFNRSTFRESLTALGRSSNWIGSILRIFPKKYPSPYPVSSRNFLERSIEVYGESGLADYLRSKGYRVVKPLDVSDREIIKFLESKGYIVNGLLNDSYYETRIDGTSQFEEQMTLKGKKEGK